MAEELKSEAVKDAAAQILDLIMDECRYWHGRDEARRGNFAVLYSAAKEIADKNTLAQLPSQGGEAVEPACWQYKVYEERRFYPTDPRKQDFWAALDGIAHSAEPLYTHPADQVADDLTMVKVSRELLKTVLDPVCTDDWAPACKQLRALLNGGRS